MVEDAEDHDGASTGDHADDPDGDAHGDHGPREREMIQLLRRAADELGESPTLAEFNELDLGTSGDAIKHAFGTWNDAKREAGLATWQRGTVVPIDEEYFAAVDTPTVAYWFGTLLARSSMKQNPTGSGHVLLLGRVERKQYFVRAFAEAIDSGYPITEISTPEGEQDQVQLQISNPTFIRHLFAAGYPRPGGTVGDFPALEPELRAPFVRGYLESSGYFSTAGWNVSTESVARGETLREWFEASGAKRPTLTERDGGTAVVRVTNVFDVEAVFRACWPDQLGTEPSFSPYVRKILDHLADEHPYPENVPYLPD